MMMNEILLFLVPLAYLHRDWLTRESSFFHFSNISKTSFENAEKRVWRVTVPNGNTWLDSLFLGRFQFSVNFTLLLCGK